MKSRRNSGTGISFSSATGHIGKYRVGGDQVNMNSNEVAIQNGMQIKGLSLDWRNNVFDTVL